MEGSEHGVPGAFLDALCPFRHFPGGLVGKCHRKNGAGIQAFLPNKVGNLGCYHPGFAGACPGEDQKRPPGVQYSFPLLGVENFKVLGEISDHVPMIVIYRLLKQWYTLGHE